MPHQPGNRLRAFAAGWCCRETMERVIDPLIADLQREHAEAVRSGRIWKSRWIQVAGWTAFAKVVVLCAAASLTSIEEWTPEDRRSLTKAAVISVVTLVVITVLLVSRSAEDIPQVLVHPSPKRLFFLAPYPFVAGMVLGATLGIVLGLGGRALSRRLVAAAIGGALTCSALVFIDVGWVAPAAHIAYRMMIGGTDPTPDIGEASLGALRRKIEQVERDSQDAPLGFLAALSFDYHRRVALSFSPLVFTLFALTMVGSLRRRWLLGIAGCVAFLVYGWLVIVVRPWDLQPWNLRAPTYAAAWLPNATIATLAAVVAIVGALRRAASRSPDVTLPSRDRRRPGAS
jgi:lipopolysaccharide export system permease LptF/LptG-like protein